MRRIHHEVPMNAWEPEQVVHLPDEASHYALRVLRLQAGATVELFNGSGEAWCGELAVDGASAVVHLHTKMEGDPAQSEALPVVLLMAQTRPKKLELVLQKATELGVSEIWIVSTERAVPRPDSERLEGRLERWDRIVLEAARQCGRRRAPEVVAHPSLARALPELPLFATARWACAVNPEKRTLSAHLRDSEVAEGAALAVGPEGGFTDEELALLQGHGFALVSLGPRVLRTETAPLVGLTVIQSHWGDLG